MSRSTRIKDEDSQVEVVPNELRKERNKSLKTSNRSKRKRISYGIQN
ncbi:10775_t:CDS:2 [Gigaspora rosea]|nr:10775_t:CDS:2 [Gigaspora rosea]